MWFKNKKTGVRWEIVNKDIIERLTKDKDFEVVPEVEEKPKVEEQTEDYSSFTFQELRTVAKEKGINTYMMSKEDILKCLEELEG